MNFIKNSQLRNETQTPSVFHPLSISLSLSAVHGPLPELLREPEDRDRGVVAGLLQLGVQPHHLHHLQQGLQQRIQEDRAQAASGLNRFVKGVKPVLCPKLLM